MKRNTILLLCLLCLLCGCGAQKQTPPAGEETAGETTRQTQAAETTVPETTVPETTVPETTVPETTQPKPTEPKTSEHRVMAAHIPVVRTLLKRGEAVEVTGYTEEGLAQVKTAGGEGLMDPQFLRFPDDKNDLWDGYTAWHAGLYRDWTCLGEPMRKMKTNAKVCVLEELEECNYVQFESMLGFIPKDSMSRYHYITNASAEAGEEAQLYLLASVKKTGPAKSRLDGAEVIARYCTLGETVRVLDEKGAEPGYAAVLEPDGSTAYIPENWLEGFRAFSAWEGFAGYRCKAYKNRSLSGNQGIPLSFNMPLKVLWDGGTVSFVQMGEQTFFVESATLMEEPMATQPPEEESVEDYIRRMRQEGRPIK